MLIEIIGLGVANGTISIRKRETSDLDFLRSSFGFRTRTFRCILVHFVRFKLVHVE